MNRYLRVVGSFVLVAFVIVGSLGVVSAEAGCSGECTATEKGTCDDNFNICVQANSTVGGAAGCAECQKVYCDCYDKCGSDCPKSTCQ